jgi:hypothetical protein
MVGIISSRVITAARLPLNKSICEQRRPTWEYHGREASLSIASAPACVGYRTEASMIKIGRVGLAAILSAAMAAQATAKELRTFASNETTTRPWSAPVGHRQPRAADIPGSASASWQIIDREDAIVDRKIRGVCRGC